MLFVNSYLDLLCLIRIKHKTGVIHMMRPVPEFSNILRAPAKDATEPARTEKIHDTDREMQDDRPEVITKKQGKDDQQRFVEPISPRCTLGTREHRGRRR
jgi:hypothetical protein